MVAPQVWGLDCARSSRATTTNTELVKWYHAGLLLQSSRFET